MSYKKRFDFNSAYGQLVLLVFLPICVLAAVGGMLVFYETMRSIDSEQEALAEAVLIRYTPLVTPLVPELLENAYFESTAVEQSSPTSVPPPRPPDDSQSMATLVAISDKLSRLQSEQHVQRLAIINEQNQVLVTVGYGADEAWPLLDNIERGASFLTQESTAIGTAYGSLLGEFAGQRLWLMIDMDNEPLYLARYRVAIALIITGLLTILILLLSLNVYAKRWIAPIYELRLQLQRTHADNLYQPILVKSDGELNLLQQDLAKTFRRLHSSFQELKNHAEQTEDDLRLAFDEMEMQNISIRNARDAAISTSQAKSAFLANISHELRTPLNSIDGFINLLARHGELNAEQDLYVHTIRKSSAHLLALVNDVLDFSKIEAGKLLLDCHEFDLYDTIYDVVDMLSPVSAEKGLRTAVLFYNDVPMRVNGDALRLKQVLTNIVGNAIKFTDSGGVVVRVSLDDHQDNHLMISVQDSGKGISATDQQMLFQSFSQGDPSITRQYGGTGLGLVISKQLVRLMGGDIGFYDNLQENIDNQGATFWFRMPAHVDVLEAPTGQTIALPMLAPLASATDEFNVLVWINHKASKQVLKASLQNLPIKLTQANSLPGVLESLKEHGNYWDWVIVDNDTKDDMMALLKQIRLHYQGKLAVFGYQVAADQALLNRYHANILYEPLDKRQLYNMLDTQPKTTPIKPQMPLWHGVTVLAVDDHLPNLLVLDALLSELGVNVITANSGFDAIEIISKQQASKQAHKPQTNASKTAKTEPQSLSNKTQISKAEMRSTDNKALPSSHGALELPAEDKVVKEDKNHIDLIFMDIQMPRMSGREAAQQIRKIEINDSRIPIIALTAHGLSDERDKLLASGIDDYVGKPISQPQLLRVLQKWLGRTASITSAPTELTTVHPATSVHDADTSSQIVSKPATLRMSIADKTKSKAMPKDKNIARPLSLKKIRDDYMRDSQPREGYSHGDYLREPPRVNQHYYQGLQYHAHSSSSIPVPDSTPSESPLQASHLAMSDTTDSDIENSDAQNERLQGHTLEHLQVFDWQDALTRAANKPDLAATLITMMLDTIPDEQAALIQAWEQRDRSELAQIAHRILGASRYTGVPQLRQASQDLEDKCSLNMQHVTPTQFVMLKPYYDALLLALSDLKTLDLSPYPQLNYHRLSEDDMTWKMI